MAAKKKSGAEKKTVIKNDDDTPNPKPKPAVGRELPKSSKPSAKPSKGSSKPVGGMKPDGGAPNGPKGGTKQPPRFKPSDPGFPGYKKRTQDPQQKRRSQDPMDRPNRKKPVPGRPSSSAWKPPAWILGLSKKKGK
jgi:hypothetical protein